MAELQEILEYRGVEGLLAAEILVDNNAVGTGQGYVTGEPFAIAGVAEIAKSVDSSTDAHYYDNIPAVVVTGNGPDTVTISTSAVPLDVLAELTGQTYDEATGALIEEPRETKYFAIGYKTKKTNGDEVYVWRLKGSFAIPDQDNRAEDNSTDANGQSLIFTGIVTTHKFTATGKGAKAVNLDVAKGLVDATDFFNTVATPDSIVPTTPTRKITIEIADGATITVKVGTQQIVSGDRVAVGSEVTYSATGAAAVSATGATISGGSTAGTLTVGASDIVITVTAS